MWFSSRKVQPSSKTDKELDSSTTNKDNGPSSAVISILSNDRGNAAGEAQRNGAFLYVIENTNEAFASL